VWFLNSVVLEGISVVAVFMAWKSWLQRPLQRSMKTTVWSVCCVRKYCYYVVMMNIVDRLFSVFFVGWFYTGC